MLGIFMNQFQSRAMDFLKKNPPPRHYDILKQKWSQKHHEVQENLWNQHKDFLQPYVDTFQNAPKQLVAGSMAGLLLLAQPAPAALVNHTIAQVQTTEQPIPSFTKEQLINELKSVIPPQVQPLTDDTNTKIAEILSKYYHFAVKQSLEGIGLNRTYGVIGAEQHLMRFPGDTMTSHFDNPADAEKYFSSGMAPGRGAWGFFAPSASEMTAQDALKEKYYIAVQTFLSPGWSTNVRKYVEFFKHRKMLVVNPENGKAAVVVIGDAGPAQWTGKHLGGSPEVMIHLERVDGSHRGPVLYFFIDDPENKVPLGTIEVQ